MDKIQSLVSLLFTRKVIGKIIAYLLLIIGFYIFSAFLGIFFLTFILAYLFLNSAQFLEHKILFLINKFNLQKLQKGVFINKYLLNFLIVTLYITFVGSIIFIISDLLPTLITELSELPKSIPFLAEPIGNITNYLVELKNFNKEIGGSIDEIFTNQDIDVVMDILQKLKSASVIFLEIIISIILSFVFLIDRFRLHKYLQGIKKSSFSFLYKEYRIILEKIVKSFGLIFKAQALIALVNSFLTVIGLIIIGLIHGGSFPFLLTLGLIVFIAGFIPVLGVFISSIPILIIAFSMIGGYTVIVEIVLLIAIVHMVEAYYLNPKIVSSFLEIPVSLTFIILIISEHLFGIAGLLIGISLFYFTLGLLRDIDKVLKKKKNNINNVIVEGSNIK